MAETIGSLVDKVSIAELRIWHTLELIYDPTVHDAIKDECRQRLVVIREQRDDLAAELATLWISLCEGRQTPKLYRQYKMYNDPKLRSVDPAREASDAEAVERRAA
ncbi:MAG: DUF4254 domain-containing protein [Myxococcales bacterium FL481]|nr:MAG: DUF4254 domain-containing protein [Myxococcales bacterium FL481]